MYSSSWHSWSKASAGRRGAVSPIKSDLLLSTPRHNSSLLGKSAVLGPAVLVGMDGRPAVSPWSVSLILISLIDTAAGAAKLLLRLRLPMAFTSRGPIGTRILDYSHGAEHPNTLCTALVCLPCAIVFEAYSIIEPSRCSTYLPPRGTICLAP